MSVKFFDISLAVRGSILTLRCLGRGDGGCLLFFLFVFLEQMIKFKGKERKKKPQFLFFLLPRRSCSSWGICQRCKSWTPSINDVSEEATRAILSGAYSHSLIQSTYIYSTSHRHSGRRRHLRRYVNTPVSDTSIRGCHSSGTKANNRRGKSDSIDVFWHLCLGPRVTRTL